jgi:Zn-dependent M28 family amino/carboxypeptidase
VRLSLNVETYKGTSVTQNILADTVGGNANSIIVVGSHLDSVPAGAGINDNGSGSSVNLEMALTLSSCLATEQRHKIRFAWWGAEERGLLGSYHYVEDLKVNNPQELANIILNLNFDMVGSPNFFYGIYNGSGAAAPIRDRSVLIQRQFEMAIGGQSKPYDLTPFDGRSDYGPFIENGIAAGGLFSGAEGMKNAAGRSIYKGLANTAYDPCYHDYCDSFDNISQESLQTLASAAYKVTHDLAISLVTNPLNQYTPLNTPHIMETHPEAFSRY